MNFVAELMIAIESSWAALPFKWAYWVFFFNSVFLISKRNHDNKKMLAYDVLLPKAMWFSFLSYVVAFVTLKYFTLVLFTIGTWFLVHSIRWVGIHVGRGYARAKENGE